MSVEIYVDLRETEYPGCLLRADQNFCMASRGDPMNTVNSCPTLNENGETWSVPDWCPLKAGPVIVRALVER